MRRKRLPDLSDLSWDDRFALITGVALEDVKELLTEAGFEDYKLVLCVEAPKSDEPGVNNAGTLISGVFEDRAAAVEMLLEHAGGMAEELGGGLIVTKAAPPENPTRGQG